MKSIKQRLGKNKPYDKKGDGTSYILDDDFDLKESLTETLKQEKEEERESERYLAVKSEMKKIFYPITNCWSSFSGSKFVDKIKDLF